MYTRGTQTHSLQQDSQWTETHLTRPETNFNIHRNHKLTQNALIATILSRETTRKSDRFCID